MVWIPGAGRIRSCKTGLHGLPYWYRCELGWRDWRVKNCGSILHRLVDEVQRVLMVLECEETVQQQQVWPVSLQIMSNDIVRRNGNQI